MGCTWRGDDAGLTDLARQFAGAEDEAVADRIGAGEDHRREPRRPQSHEAPANQEQAPPDEDRP